MIRKNMMLVLLIIVSLIAVYWFFFIRDSSSGDLVTTSTSLPGAQTTDLINALGNLQQITFDNSIFKDPVFTSLTDFGVQLPLEPVGRKNPFAPLQFSNSSGGSLPNGISSGTRTH